VADSSNVTSKSIKGREFVNQLTLATVNTSRRILLHGIRFRRLLTELKYVLSHVNLKR
jgi:hypothetical protein